MAYVGYTGLKTPNQILEKMVEYITAQGYIVIQPLADDLNIYDMSTSDGKKVCFMDKTATYFITLRSANGYMVFGTNDEAQMDVTTPITNSNYTGIAMTVSEGYSATKRWYNQYKAPQQINGKNIYGVFMPVHLDVEYDANKVYSVGDYVRYNGDICRCTSATFDQTSSQWIYTWAVDNSKEAYLATTYEYTLYCNEISSPTDTLAFSLVRENDDYHPCTHLLYANIDKYEDWDGGALFSGSSIRARMGTDVKVYEHEITSDSYILPLLSSGAQSNTFLRIDIDEAPTEARGFIYWACSGTANETGKKLSLPIRTGLATNGKIPHYYYLQSHDRLDWGRNVNTLNCITIDMPIFAAVLVDPDALENYAAVGNITGVYCISVLNMQTAGVYEKSYPNSGILDQVFPHGKRRGYYGFDGIAISQQLDEDN